MRQHVVLIASGEDRPGVLKRFTQALLEYEGNVEASRMAHLGGAFAMLMLVSTPNEKVDALCEAVSALRAEQFDVHVRLTEPTEVAQPRGYRPCGLTVSGADHMGIIHQIADYLARKGVNVENMSTEVVAAPMSGAPLFTMSAVVLVPPSLTVDELRASLGRLGDDVGVETSVFAHVDEAP